MGSAQTLASKSSQENVTSNNARSVDDCSAQGVSLQRKAITMQGNSNVMQRMAWVAIKPLDPVYKAYATIASAPENKRKPYEPLTVDSKSVAEGNAQGWNKKRKRMAYNADDLQLHHRHFIFSPLSQYENPTADDLYVQRELCRMGKKSDAEGIDNNIGYRSSNGLPRGKGELFSEDVYNRGYTVMEQISNSPEKDKKLVNAMWNYLPSKSSWYETYNLGLSNCQDWVEDVRKKAGL